MTPDRDVVHVTTAHPHLDNRIFWKECSTLARAGLPVRLVAVAPHDLEVEGVPITALPRRRGRAGRMLLGPFDAWRALRRLEPALVHLHDPELIPLGVLWRLLHRCPVVYDAHEDLVKQVAGKTYIPASLREPVARLAGLLERAADRGVDAVVAATPSIARNYRRAPVVLVQNFPWLRDFPDLAEDDRPDRSLTLCYVGGITAERGGREMLQAVNASTRSPRLLLAGAASPDMVTEIEADTSRRVQHLGLLPVDQVPSVIRRSDAGLVLFHPLPNHVEAQPTKLFEYMASGKPFVASDFLVWRELLETFDCGYFVDPLDVDGLIAVIEEIAADPGAARARGARGRRALVEHFTFESESERLTQLTTALLEGRTDREVGTATAHTTASSRGGAR